jgi:hypothetical protein
MTKSLQALDRAYRCTSPEVEYERGYQCTAAQLVSGSKTLEAVLDARAIRETIAGPDARRLDATHYNEGVTDAVNDWLRVRQKWIDIDFTQLKIQGGKDEPF